MNIARLLLLICFFSGSLAAATAVPYGFSLLPQVITPKKTVFVLYLATDPDVSLEARAKGKKIRYKYSRGFIKFMKGLNLNKSDFLPFRSYLKSQIKAAKLNPGPYLDTLRILLQNGATPDFRIQYV